MGLTFPSNWQSRKTGKAERRNLRVLVRTELQFLSWRLWAPVVCRHHAACQWLDNEQNVYTPYCQSLVQDTDKPPMIIHSNKCCREEWSLSGDKSARWEKYQWGKNSRRIQRLRLAYSNCLKARGEGRDDIQFLVRTWQWTKVPFSKLQNTEGASECNEFSLRW
jgi:hypothetical protein